MTAVRQILLINLIVFVVTYILQLNGLYLNNILALYPIDTEYFSAYQLFTHTFSHSGIDHFVSNMFMFLIFSPTVEEKFGRKKFWNFWILSGLCSSALYCLFSNQAIIGASGCVYAVLGAYLLTNKVSMFSLQGYGNSIKTLINLFVIFLFSCEIHDLFYTSDDIAHLGHILGFIFGVFYKKFTPELN